MQKGICMARLEIKTLYVLCAAVFVLCLMASLPVYAQDGLGSRTFSDERVPADNDKRRIYVRKKDLQPAEQGLDTEEKPLAEGQSDADSSSEPVDEDADHSAARTPQSELEEELIQASEQYLNDLEKTADSEQRKVLMEMRKRREIIGQGIKPSAARDDGQKSKDITPVPDDLDNPDTEKLQEELMENAEEHSCEKLCEMSEDSKKCLSRCKRGGVCATGEIDCRAAQKDYRKAIRKGEVDGEPVTEE